jgi:hypothetical protein
MVMENMSNKYSLIQKTSVEFQRETEMLRSGLNTLYENEKMSIRLVSFSVLPRSLDACVQSSKPLIRNGFKFFSRDCIEYPHYTVEKFLFNVECYLHQRRFQLPKETKV